MLDWGLTILAVLPTSQLEILTLGKRFANADSMNLEKNKFRGNGNIICSMHLCLNIFLGIEIAAKF